MGVLGLVGGGGGCHFSSGGVNERCGVEKKRVGDCYAAAEEEEPDEAQARNRIAESGW